MPSLPALRPVQELLQSGTVPEWYIQQKDVHQGPDAPPLPYMDGPNIDLSLLSSSSEELANLHSALTSWGCAQLVNHGISSSFLDEVRKISKEFFALPLEEKEKYSSKSAGLEGYGNTNATQRDTFNWNDKLHLQVHPQESRKLEFWPEKPENFRNTVHEYSIKIRMILETLLKAMEFSLKLEENRFSEVWQAEEDTIYARFNYYPPCPNSNVLGLKPHGDGTVITILLQDKEVEALQVLKDNQWFRVPIIPEALVILAGDQMEIASNGIFKSPTHKVTVNPNVDRISLAMLSIPNLEKEIGPLHELIKKERPQLYKRLKDYGQIYQNNIPDGKRPIDFVKIN